VNFADVVAEKDYVIYKCATSFNPEKKTKFSTWVGNHARYHCLNLINKNNHYVSMEDDKLDYFAENESIVDNSTNKEQERAEILEYIFNILSQLKDERIKKVFERRYLSEEKDKLPWAQIAEEMDVSTQTAINLHNRGRAILRKKMNSETFLDNI
jgi:RNA polymerase sigma factor (sigma-70 family)